ncbi:MAG: hypothetical protein KatS3mg076_1389 [Candidatus Binatia bacterium]|nr:MAG: hypothetical protein KatS3mg076_1389 [Candidatus Binatia bacterium]
MLFSDIRGFTSLAEGWDPEELISTMNAYFEEMTDVVFAHGGTLDKYMGDAVMAFWGAPLEQSDHARRACATALEMLRRLEALNRAWAEEGKPELECGIGIATGEMIVGNLGSRRRLSYTVVGDSVNLASRLEALNKTYGTRILLSENVVELAGGDFLVREIDRIQVRGKTRATRIFELLGTAGDAAALRTRVDRFERALRFYREGKFPEARELFSALAREEGGGVAAYYEKRCGERLGSPAA